MIYNQSEIKIFSTLPDHARVWVYASQRALTESEIVELKNQVSVFTVEWNAHGAQMEAAFEVLENRFLILAANEEVTTASGCSIDKSVRVFQEISNTLNLNLLERANVFYEKENEIHFTHFTRIPELLSNGTINADTLVFDTTIDSVAKLKSTFKNRLKDTWLSRYLNS